MSSSPNTPNADLVAIESLPVHVRQQLREKFIDLLNGLGVPFTLDPAGEVNAPLEKLADALGIPLSEATEMLFGRAN